MPFRDVLQPSFRGRLRLFFLVIVLLPLVAVGAVLFVLLSHSDERRIDGRLTEAEKGAGALLQEQQLQAGRVVRRIARDRTLAVVLRAREEPAIRTRLGVLTRRSEARQVRLRIDRIGTFDTGRGPSVGVRSAPLANGRRTVGRLTVAMTAAQAFADRLHRLLGVEAHIAGPRALVATTLDADRWRGSTPGHGGMEIAGREYRSASFRTPGFDGAPLTVTLLLPASDNASALATALIVLAVSAGFLALASAFAVIVSRSLQAEIDPLLLAARRLGAGDFSVHVPTEGSGEFSALGKAFNTMARQLEARLEELERERGRLQDAIRRVGESFARGLDREGLLEIVVQTAVDGIGAEGGRATIRQRDGATLSEVARAGRPESHAAALRQAEAGVLARGEVFEAEEGGGQALAAPLGNADGRGPVGVVSVVRPDRPFTAEERELFAYLATQAGLSVENVDLHETVQRQAVTDELTGLFNHRRFQEVMAVEVERARRFGQEMGLIMLDIDNFKRVNDTYGHMQGDLVLREVAQVLRDSAREIDEPARYGGEEMTVALPQTDLDGAYRFAERVRRRIEGLELPLLEGDGTLRVTASVGAASLATAPGQDADSLVAAADAALYRAKRSGKNRTVKAE
jgi:diguanylate cyclase (GGDEF)-like protein